MLKGYDLMRAFGRYSIVGALAAPIYVFASGEYHDPPKLAISILILFVILTTYMYWGISNMEKTVFWKIADRCVVLALMILPLVYGDNDTRTFIALGAYFYFLGYSSSWVDHNGHLNHAAFRYFAALGLILYLVKDSDKVYQDVFVGLVSLILISGSYLIIKDYRQDNKIVALKNSSIIF